MRISGIILGALLAFVMCAAATAQSSTLNVSVLYTGDTHGHLRSFYYDSTKPVGGVAKRAIFFQEKRRHKKMAWVTLDAGDAMAGTALSDVFQGYLDVEAMNRLNYDAMVLGVHDFDYGVAVLRQRMSEAKFAMLSANVSDSAGQPFAKPYVIIEREGVKIAVLGLTTGELGQRVAAENISGLSVSDPIEVARTLVPQLRSQADVVIALTHLGVNEDIRLAGQVRGIDLIIGGMSHSELQVPMRVGETLISHDATFGSSVGMMKMSFAPKVGGGHEKVYFSSQLIPMDGKWAENSNYITWLDTFTPQLQERMGLIVGTAAIQMADTRIHSSETELGNLVCDIIREKTGADAALLPAAFFRAGLPKGPVTLGDLYTVLPYDHYCDILRVTGGELQQILNDAANQIGKEGFPQVSGLSFGIFNGKGYQIKLNGTDIDPFATYELATSDYLAAGSLGYATMGTITDRRYTGRLIRDMVRDNLASGAVASSTLYGRISFMAQEPAVASVPPTTEETPSTPVEEEIVPPETPAEQPAGESPPVEDETLPPADGAAQPGSETTGQPAGEQPGGETGEGLDALKYDRNGEPLLIEDEVITDDASGASGSQPPAEETAPGGEAPPDETSAPAADTPPTTPREPVSQGAILGQTRDSQGGLDYQFTLLATEEGYEFQLEIVNNSPSEIVLDYTTGETFDFLCYSGTDLRWNNNNNIFFVQSPERENLAAGERLLYRAPWKGVDNSKRELPQERYRFEAVHLLSNMPEPVRLALEALLSK